MVLVYDEILDRVDNPFNYKDVYEVGKAKPLIDNFRMESLQSVSYDMSIGNKIMKLQDEFNTIYLSAESDVDRLFVEEDITNGYKLRPNEYILVRLDEGLNMPDDLTGHMRPRTTFNKLGLIITSQHINPSYKGHLQLGIKNTTPNVVVLTPGLKVAQVVFEKLSGKIRTEILYRNKPDSKYQGEDNFVASKVYNETSKERANELYNKLINSFNGTEN